MGWVYDVDHPAAFEHEGYAALVLDDGELTGEHSARTAGRVVGWRAACDCGWLHPLILKTPAAMRGSTAAPPAFEASLYALWSEHLRHDVPALYFHDRDLSQPQPWPHEP